ncbi:ketol-acid reductoisomerase [Candidatus Bathyarchaeota archaeon]|jgi:ketol-acid reductoisomerase|nr:ketol-acid reductoisomerase [Candidatus Bathyarchaeota archaeon]MDP6048385.1 ketol-acid reductoisomerase [Candidatus Bathyarchaeota archaeon]MDP6458314.1 ketol-acid reductoisomerase [Candidatus Bathyarchaeota archaeon]MDP7442863.1 ketol-acid reductoisomerase [Candidatus Bathyarchaeota archaeon]
MIDVYHDKDIDDKILKGKKVAVIGYGSQGRAQALNMKESGVDVIVGLRPGKSWERAEADNMTVKRVIDAANEADVILMLVPDMAQPTVFAEEVSLAMKPGKALQFAHGFNVHFGQIKPPEWIDVIMVAPKAPGPELRRQYEQGFGVPALIAVAQDATGQAKAKALAIAKALGSGRAGVIETTFKDETESDLFGEQAVLCGGTDWLIRRGFKVLTDAGYPPELAYFEVLNELKLIVDLIYKSGISGMYAAVSDTAKFGGMTVGPMIIDDHVEDNMRAALKAIQSGEFSNGWIADYEAGSKEFQRLYDECKNLEIEKVGKRVRQMSGLEK